MKIGLVCNVWKKQSKRKYGEKEMKVRKGLARGKIEKMQRLVSKAFAKLQKKKNVERDFFFKTKENGKLIMKNDV